MSTNTETLCKYKTNNAQPRERYQITWQIFKGIEKNLLNPGGGVFRKRAIHAKLYKKKLCVCTFREVKKLLKFNP